MIRCLKSFTFLLLLVTAVWGQPSNENGKTLIKKWDVVEYNYKGSLLFGATQSIYGEVVVVGEQTINGIAQGLLLRINPENGQVFDSKAYPGNGQLRSIVQLEKGGFLLVGSKMENNQKKGWILWTDSEGNLLDERSYAAREDLAFSNVLVYNQEYVIAAGGFGDEKSGSMAVWKIALDDLSQVLKQVEIGEGGYQDIKGIHLNANNQIQLVGNTQRVRKRVDADNLWVHTFDENLNTVYNQTQIYQTEAREQLHNTYRSPRGEWWTYGDYIGGRSRSIFMYPVDQSGIQMANTLVKQDPNTENGMGIKTIYGQHFLANNQIVYTPMDIATHYTWLYRADGRLLSDYEIPKQAGAFALHDILETFDGGIVLVGFDYRDRENVFPRFIRLDGIDLLSPPKSMVQLSFVQQPTLVEKGGSGDGVLMPGEQLYIYFKIKNVSELELYGGQIAIESSREIGGLKYRATAFIGLLESNQERSFYIPVSGGNNLISADTDFLINITKSDRTLLQSSVNLKCNPVANNSIEKEIILELKEPANKNARTLSGSQPIRLQVLSNKPLNPNDFTIYIDNAPLPSSRSQTQLKSISSFSNMPFAYEFEKVLNFDQPGEYQVYVQVKGDVKNEVTPVRVIQYQPKSPNLHVISIGPSFGKYDLKYNVKDAGDFAAIMREQAGNGGLYGDIFVDEFATDEKTTRTQIAAYFEKLRGRALPEYANVDKIYKNDVLVIFISSHGKLVNGALKIIPSDYDQEAEQSTTVDYKRDLLTYLEGVNCKKLLFIDACHSGAAKAKALSMDKESYYAEKIIELFNATPGLSTLTSSQANQFSFEDDAWQNGAFTEALVEAFQGRADYSGNGYLSINEIYGYIEYRVPELLSEIHGSQTDRFRQEPALTRTELNLDTDFFKIVKKTN